jgi:PAS domain S-box-containing protein
MDLEQPTFKDLVDFHKLELLFENFSAATGFTTGLLDHTTKEVLLGTGWRDICVKFHHICPASSKHCNINNKKLASGLTHAGEISIHHCENGLVDGSTPIVIEGKHFADLFTGQIRFTPPDIEHFKLQARRYGYDEQSYLQSLGEVPVVSEEKFNAMLRFLVQMASMIAETGLANLKIRQASMEREALLQSIFKSAPLGIGLVVNRVFQWTNHKLSEITGYSSAELKGKKSSMLYLSKEEFERVGQEKSSQVKKTGTGFVDTQFRRKDGSIADVHLSSTPQNKDDWTAGDIFTALDTTELNKAFDIINWSTSIAFLWRNEKSWPVDFVSDNVLGLTGYSPQEFTSGKVSYADHIVHPDDLERVSLEITKASKNQTTKQLTHKPYRIITRNKEIKWVSDSSRLKRNSTGRITHYQGIVEDITDRKKNALALRKSKEEWEKTFNAIPDIITIQDREMRVVRANKAAHTFLGAEYGDLIGKYCHDIFGDISELCDNCPTVYSNKDFNYYPKTIRHENLGKVFQISSSPILDENQEVQFLVHIIKDVTEQKRIEEELLQSQKMKAVGTLASGIAHDFNNILSAIMGYSEIAKLSLPAYSPALKDIDEVLKASNRAADLVKQILTFSRKPNHHRGPIAPHLVVEEALQMMRSSMPATVKIQQNIDKKCGVITADPTNLHQIIVNLCTNALHALEDEKGVIDVSLKLKNIKAGKLRGEPDISPGKFIVLKISDTGHGMDQATIERIFDPYFTTKKVGKGTGLGLAVIHGIVKEYNGFIRVQSEVGKGTSFYVHIPAIKQETSTIDDTQEVTSLPTGNERLLIVDDESAIVNLKKVVLEQLGYKVTATTESLDALKTIRADPSQFDLIITDQTMPELTGTELTREVLQIKPDMPVILCTGHSTVISEESALAAGIKKYLQKPVNRATLSQSIRQVLDKN